MAARSLSAPISAFQPTSAGLQSARSTWTPSTTLSTETTTGPPAGHVDHGGVVAQPAGLDSTSERVADTLQRLVFNQTRRAPRFGGTHGTCLALDAACTGRTKE